MVRRLTSDEMDIACAVRLIARYHDADVPPSHLRDVLTDPANVLFLATLDQRDSNDITNAVGFLFAHRLDRFSRAAKHYLIYEIEVDAAQRRRGVGRSLMNAMLELARAERSDCFVLTNHANPGARAFYEATGGVVKNGDDLLFVYRAGGIPRHS